MKTTVTISTYWCSPSSEKRQPDPENDYLYDHATPLDEDGTLAAALDALSAAPLIGDMMIAIVAVPTHREINQAVQLKVQSILSDFDFDCPVYLIGPDQLAFWRQRLAVSASDESHGLLSFTGYANVGNICLLIAMLTGADTVVMLDDRMLVKEPEFLRKAVEFIGKEYAGEKVSAVSGVMGPAPDKPAGKGEGQRLSASIYASGGPLVLHRSLFEQLPFDPAIRHGVDKDYLLDARIYEHSTYSDGHLHVDRIETIPRSPAWYMMRQKIMRLYAERSKLADYLDQQGLDQSEAELSDLYGSYLSAGALKDLIIKDSVELAFRYLRDGQEEEAGECMDNIAMCRPLSGEERDWLGEYRQAQQQWSVLMSSLDVESLWPVFNNTD